MNISSSLKKLIHEEDEEPSPSSPCSSPSCSVDGGAHHEEEDMDKSSSDNDDGDNGHQSKNITTNNDEDMNMEKNQSTVFNSTIIDSNAVGCNFHKHFVDPYDPHDPLLPEETTMTTQQEPGGVPTAVLVSPYPRNDNNHTTAEDGQTSSTRERCSRLPLMLVSFITMIVISTTVPLLVLLLKSNDKTNMTTPPTNFPSSEPSMNISLLSSSTPSLRSSIEIERAIVNEGQNVKCDGYEDNQIYRYTNQQLRHYPSSEIFTSWNKSISFTTIDCTGIPKGRPMTFKVDEGQNVKCNASDLDIYRYTNQQLRLYPSNDKSGRSSYIVIDCAGMSKGPPLIKLSDGPSLTPSVNPSFRPSPRPSVFPSLIPTSRPSPRPSIFPSLISTSRPTLLPSQQPSPKIGNKEPSLCIDSAVQLSSGNRTCKGCRKDLFSGRYVYCNGGYEGSTKTNCDWVGGTGCTFPAEKNVSPAECQQKCADEPECRYFTTYYDSICNLHLMESCDFENSGAPGIVKELVRCFTPEPTPAPSSKPSVCTSKATQLSSGNRTCKGCYKDLFAGRYTYCNGYYVGSTKTGCDWVGGAGCTFPAEKNVSPIQCQQKCENEPGCKYFTTYHGSICNLHLMESCDFETAVTSGIVKEIGPC